MEASSTTEELVKSVAAKCHYVEVTKKGDRAISIDQNPILALDAAREVITTVGSILPRQPAVRFGGDFGVIVFEEIEGRRKPIGAPLRTSARLEGKAGVGKCLVSEAFITYSGDRTKGLFNDGAEINMSKDCEPPQHVNVFEGFLEAGRLARKK